MRHALPIVFVGLLVSLAACHSSQKASTRPDSVSMGAMNGVCPVMNETFDQANPPASVSYEGHTIGFCCTGCVNTWNGWDTQRKADFMASLGHAH